MCINREKLPTREFRIKDDKGREIGSLDDISVVTDPAIESEFQLFKSADLNYIEFKTSSNEKRQITGPAMIPNKKMLRKDSKTGELYLGWFSEETIVDCAKNYMRRGRNRRGNLEHADDYSKDLYVFESWVVTDPETDKSKALGFKDVVKGTWFITYQVCSQEKWEEIKNGGFKGLSVEVQTAMFKEQLIEDDIKAIVFNETLTDEQKEGMIRDLLK